MSIHSTGYWAADSAEPHHAYDINLSNWIVSFLEQYKSHRIYDFGCGPAHYLENLHNNGFTDVVGIEGDPIKKDYPFEVRSANLSEELTLEKNGVVICLEVGEHIPAEYTDTLLNNIASTCNSLLICSWAIRGQGGHGHVNELNNDEIIPMIENKGFVYLEKESVEVRNLDHSSCPYFTNTLMIFQKTN